jgi:hypothetical protein
MNSPIPPIVSRIPPKKIEHVVVGVAKVPPEPRQLMNSIESGNRLQSKFKD